MKQRLLCFFMLGILLIGSAYAQDRRINGRVTSAEDGAPISGVSVLAVGTNVATQTDALGTFTITVPNTVKAIEFRYLGFAYQTVTLGTSNSLEVVLSPDATSLEEVVVTGLGVAVERKKVAIAIESVKAEDLASVPSASISQALVGKIAGAQISATSGQPGQQAAILLRGITTLGSTQPMILVDGVQINAGNNNNGSAQNLSSRLSDLDLSNVERVEVVQGSAAATIYGAQGANGVIQIFTKRGQRNSSPSISLSTRLGVENTMRGNFSVASKHFFGTNSEGYIIDDEGNRLVENENGAWNTPNLPASFVGVLNNKPYKEQIYDHFDQIFVDNALTSNTSLGISGGSDKADYAFNLSHLNQEGTIFGRLKRNNLTANIGIEPVKNLTVRSISQLAFSTNTTGGVTGANNIYGAFGSGMLSRQYWDLTFRNADGHTVSNPEGDNAVNPLYTQQFREYGANTTRIVQNFNINYKFPKFVEIDYKYGVDHYRYDFKDFVKFQENVRTPGPGLPPKNGSLTYDRDSETFQNSLLSVYFKTDFQEDFGSDLPIQTSTHLAYDWRDRDYQNVTSTGSGFSPFPPYNLSTAAAQTNEEEKQKFITYGYLINQRIDYGTLFGVSGGVRVDYASTFGGADFTPFVFPRGDAYFNIGNLLQSNTVSDFKLRAAYGAAGTQPGPYDRFITLNTGNIGNTGYLGLKFTANNPDLNVQVSKEFEVGTDVQVNLRTSEWFKTLRFSGTYWTSKNEDVIRALDLAPSSGTAAILTNAITIDADGIQLSLDADVLERERFTWDFGIRFGRSKSVIAKIANGRDITIGESGAGQFVLREGERVSTFFGKLPLSSISQVDANGDRYIDPADESDYELVNGMVVNKNTQAVQFTSDNHRLGDPTPKFNMTFLNSFRIYNNLNVSFQLDWIYGNQIYNQTKQWMYRDYMHSDFDKEVVIGGVSGAYVNYYNSLYNTNQNNSHFVEDGSFLRLRDITLSYDFAGLLLNGGVSFIKNLQLSASAFNLFTITKYTGMDPEASARLNSPIYRGLDLWAYPNSRVFQFGLSVGF